MKRTLFLFLLLFITMLVYAQRREILLKQGWKFHLGEVEGAESPDFIDSDWQSVTIPHDWAITGPFDRQWDLQKVAVRQNGESVATWKTGRSGGLPYIGVGWYRTTFFAPASGNVTLVFDGAMSEAHVFVNRADSGRCRQCGSSGSISPL